MPERHHVRDAARAPARGYRRVMVTMSLIAAAVAGPALSGAGGAVAAADAPAITLSPTSGPAGGWMVVSGVGFPARVAVGVTFGMTDVGSTRTSKKGVFRHGFTTPAGYTGSAPVRASHASVSASAWFTVTASPSTTTTVPITSTTTTIAPTTTTTVPDSTRALLFGDEFDGTSLNVSKWSTCYFWDNRGCTNPGNGELQWYVPEQVSVSDGLLRLQARRQSVLASDGRAYDYTSGMVSTGGNDWYGTPPQFTFRYGYAEIRAKVPAGKGLWPAFWMLPADRSWPPEIDVMEFWGENPTRTSMAVAWMNADGTYAQSWSDYIGPDFSAGWHTFGVDWQPGAITWYVDGQVRKVFTDATKIPSKPMYLLANLAVDGKSGGPDATTLLPSSYEIDYIRVWNAR